MEALTPVPILLTALAPVLLLSEYVFIINFGGSCLAMSCFGIHSSILSIKRNTTLRKNSSNYKLWVSTHSSEKL